MPACMLPHQPRSITEAGAPPVQLREKRDEAATRDRFWDITQSKIGQLTGTTAAEEQTAAADAEQAGKTTAKFAGTAQQDEGALLHCACCVLAVVVLMVETDA